MAVRWSGGSRAHSARVLASSMFAAKKHGPAAWPGCSTDSAASHAAGVAEKLLSHWLACCCAAALWGSNTAASAALNMAGSIFAASPLPRAGRPVRCVVTCLLLCPATSAPRLYALRRRNGGRLDVCRVPLTRAWAHAVLPGRPVLWSWQMLHSCSARISDGEHLRSRKASSRLGRSQLPAPTKQPAFCCCLTSSPACAWLLLRDRLGLGGPHSQAAHVRTNRACAPVPNGLRRLCAQWGAAAAAAGEIERTGERSVAQTSRASKL